MKSPYLVIRLWLKWEILDINAILEAIEGKAKLERKRLKIIAKKDGDKKDLEKLNRG